MSKSLMICLIVWWLLFVVVSIWYLKLERLADHPEKFAKKIAKQMIKGVKRGKLENFNSVLELKRWSEVCLEEYNALLQQYERNFELYEKQKSIEEFKFTNMVLKEIIILLEKEKIKNA